MKAMRCDGPSDDPCAGLAPVSGVGGVGEYLKRLWHLRDFIVQIPLGQLRTQTGATLLGGLWHVLNPLMHAALYYLIFGVLLEAARGVDNYVAFLTVGVFTFMFTSRTITAGASSISGNLTMISQIRFPRAALTLAASLGELFTHAIALIVLLGILLLGGEAPNASWLALPFIVALQWIFHLGLSLFAARLAFHSRDVQNLLPHALRFWLYASGVFFTADLVSERVGESSFIFYLFQLNPMHQFLSLTRAALLESYSVSPWQIAAVCAWSAAALIGGFAFFRARESAYSAG